MDVSAVIPTYNEEENLRTTLDSVKWCDEIFVVDSQSTDRTPTIATNYGATVIDAPKPAPGEPFDHLRGLGVEAASNDWVLFIDADEEFPNTLQKELQVVVDELVEDVNIIRVPTLEFLGGKELGSGRMDYSPILMKKDVITIKKDVHNWIEFDNPSVHNLPNKKEFAIRHSLADSLFNHWRDQREYAKIAAGNRPFEPLKIVLAPLWGLYKRVIEQQCWRDGITGVGIGLCYSWFLFETHLRTAIKELDIHDK